MAFVAVVGAGVARQFRPTFLASRWFGILSVIPVFTLLMTLAAWVFYLRPVARIIDTGRVDRLAVFDAFAEAAGDSWQPPGLVAGGRISVGLYLVILLALAYLAEKYALAWWRVRWPVPLAPVAMLASLTWIVIAGEGAQRDAVASHDWRIVAERHTFLQTLDACAAIGDGWTLPRPSELQLYISTRPDGIREWTDAAWTSTVAERGARAPSSWSLRRGSPASSAVLPPVSGCRPKPSTAA